MNTREKASEGILSFLNSDNKFLLLTGTHQDAKHRLVLSIVFTYYPTPENILFRVNHSRWIKKFLTPIIKIKREPKRGIPEIVNGSYRLFTDTINPRSWRSLREDIDVAIIYPIDALDYDKGEENVHDIIRRNAKKVFLVSWLDNHDFGWTSQFNPIHVKFDIEEERPEVHKKLIKITSTPFSSRKIPSNLPKYAQTTDTNYLINILCRNCRKGRWVKLNKPYPGKTAINQAEAGEYIATCLICGRKATDNYNW